MNLAIKRQQHGYVLLTITALSIALIAFLGLVVDVGTMRYWKRRAQNAADMAAIGGINEVNTSGSTADYSSAGKRESATNGMQDGMNGVTVSLNYPPQRGRFAGKPRYTEAYVTKQMPLSFMSILNLTTATITARSVATSLSSDACIIALAPSGDGKFNASGSSIFDTQCGIAVRSTGAKAFQVGASACVSATSISVVGGSSAPGAATGCPVSPVVKTGIPTFDDPLASLPAPLIPTTCDRMSFKLSAGTATLNPGTYCGGLTINGGSVTLNPGLYIIKGGGITMNAGTVITGQGVTFYVTAGGGYGYGAIKLNGTATERLWAPTSGTYEGILFFGDRAYTGTHTISGNNNSIFEGTIYFPSNTVTFTGNNGFEAYSVLIANDINITGNAAFHNDYSSLENGNPLRLTGGVTVE